jgi:histidinol-phosphate aminotransferase
MHRIRAPFAFSIGAQAAAIAALKDDAFVTRSREHNRQWRGWFAEQVDALPGLRAVPSKANFVLVLFEGGLTAEEAYKALMAAGYATRWLPGQGLPHGLRITIGTEDEMRAVVAVLRAEVERAG